MIRSNNPAIDVEALMRRVREDAARLRNGDTIENARRQRWNTPADRVHEIVERQKAIQTALAMAEHRNQPRTQVPARLAVFRGWAHPPARWMLRVFNYLSKPQREVAAAQNAVLRELTDLVAGVAQDVNRLAQRVAVLSEQLESRESTVEET